MLDLHFEKHLLFYFLWTRFVFVHSHQRGLRPEPDAFFSPQGLSEVYKLICPLLGFSIPTRVTHVLHYETYGNHNRRAPHSLPSRKGKFFAI